MGILGFVFLLPLQLAALQENDHSFVGYQQGCGLVAAAYSHTGYEPPTLPLSCLENYGYTPFTDHGEEVYVIILRDT